MAIHAHPADDLVLAYAVGSLPEAAAVLVATHLALCPQCRSVAGQWEAVGGAVMEDLPPAPLSDAMRERVTARLHEAASPLPAARSEVRESQAPLLPQPLRSYVGGEALDRLPWRRRLNFDYVDLKTRGPGHGRLVRVAPGDHLPYRGHTGDELVLVLAGGYGDCTGDYERGDVAMADPALAHEPTAAAGVPCVCMTVNYGWVLPTRWLAPIGRLFHRRSH